MFACSNEPHSPWNKGDASRYEKDTVKLPPYFVDTEETRSNFVDYLAEITYFDGQVGRCLELLNKYKLAENTLVIVTSEQGSSFPFAKWTCYDSGLQNALIARWPGRIKPGSVSDAMIEYVDITPTFVDAAGGKPEHAAIQNELRQRLADWMAAQGDKGQQTEPEAREHQGRNRKKKKKSS